MAENIFDFTLSFNFEYTLTSGAKGYHRVVIQNSGVSNSLSIKGHEITVDGNPLPLPAGASSPRLAGADVSILVLFFFYIRRARVRVAAAQFAT